MFQSAPACERATIAASLDVVSTVVSIRARVRAGDVVIGHSKCLMRCFNPRPRASGRPPPRQRRRRSIREGFNPRPRASGRPAHKAEMARRVDVSIRARVRAGDRIRLDTRKWLLSFQSAPACERATSALVCAVGRQVVSIRARVRAGDVSAANVRSRHYMQFQSAPACERATRLVAAADATYNCFNPRPRASGRLGHSTLHSRCRVFQSAPACERATACRSRLHVDRKAVSIRARVRAGDVAIFRPRRARP